MATYCTNLFGSVPIKNVNADQLMKIIAIQLLFISLSRPRYRYLYTTKMFEYIEAALRI